MSLILLILLTSLKNKNTYINFNVVILIHLIFKLFSVLSKICTAFGITTGIFKANSGSGPYLGNVTHQWKICNLHNPKILNFSSTELFALADPFPLNSAKIFLSVLGAILRLRCSPNYGGLPTLNCRPKFFVAVLDTCDFL